MWVPPFPDCIRTIFFMSLRLSVGVWVPAFSLAQTPIPDLSERPASVLAPPLSVGGFPRRHPDVGIGGGAEVCLTNPEGGRPGWPRLSSQPDPNLPPLANGGWGSEKKFASKKEPCKKKEEELKTNWFMHVILLEGEGVWTGSRAAGWLSSLGHDHKSA